MKALLISFFLIILLFSASSRYVAPYDERDLNTTEYTPTGLTGNTPTSFDNVPSELHFLNWVIPTFKNINLIGDGNIIVTPNKLDSTISIGFDTDINVANIEISGQLFADFLQIGLHEPTGFPNKCSDVIISFDDSSKTFSIQPSGASFDVFHAGLQFTKTAEETIVTTDEEGAHYIYYDGTGELQENATPTFSELEDILENDATVAVFYWNTTADQNIYFTGTNECHGTRMDGATHAYIHFSQGTLFISGLALDDIDADGTGDDAANAQISISDGIIEDEDVVQNIIDDSPQNLSLPANIPIFYRNGASNWKKIAATDYPVTTTGTGRAAWNEFTGGAWQLTEITNNQFVLSHIFATNNFYEPIVMLVGQSDYATLVAAREGAATEIGDLITSGLGFQEFVPIATLIFQTNNGYANAVKSRIRTTVLGDEYIDWRFQKISASTSPADHSNLAGLGDDDHNQYIPIDGSRPVLGLNVIGDSNFVNIGVLGGTWLYSDLNIFGFAKARDINVLGDINVGHAGIGSITAPFFFGDGSGLTGVSASADLNGDDVRFNNVEIDANIGVQGDANFYGAVGMLNDLWIENDLNVAGADSNMFNLGLTGKLFVDKDAIIFEKIKGKDANSVKGKNAVALGEGTTSFGANSFSGGQAFSDIVADGNASFAFGYAEETGVGGIADMRAIGIGSKVSGYIYSIYDDGIISADGNGSFATGWILGDAGIGFPIDTKSIKATGRGAHAFGYICSSPFDCLSGTSSSTALASGDGSFVIGGSTASGGLSYAFGSNNTASGDHSVAIGEQATASGDYSFALHKGTATGLRSFAMGTGTSTNNLSFSGGGDTFSKGNNSFSYGLRAQALGDGSVAMGYAPSPSDKLDAVGVGSVAMGYADINMTASGTGSIALGYNNIVTGIATVALGRGLVCSADEQVCVKDLNVSNDINAKGDLNIAGDANLFTVSAGWFFGDGSGLTNVSAISDLNGEDIAPSGVFMTGIIKLLVTDSPPACSAALLGGTYFDISEDQPCVCRNDGGAYTWAEMDAQGADCT